MALNFVRIYITVTSLLAGVCSLMVFVSNSTFGKDNVDCGQTAQNPCKSLQYAISVNRLFQLELILDGGETTKRFEYILRYPVAIYKNISIRKRHNRRQKGCKCGPNPVITTDSSNVKVAFTMERSLMLTVEGIDFNKIGIVEFETNGKVKLKNSIVSNVYEDVFKLLQGKALIITNSTIFYGVNAIINNTDIKDVTIHLQNSTIIGIYKKAYPEIALHIELESQGSRLSVFVSYCTFKLLTSAIDIVIKSTKKKKPYAMLNIINSTFFNNSAATELRNHYSTINIQGNTNAVIKNCVFRDNKSFNGGAIKTENVNNLKIHNCIFLSNSAINSGGACYFQGALGKIIITESSFMNNSVHHAVFDEKGVDDRGGAINNNMNLLIEHTMFNGNHVHSFGGGINHERSETKKNLLKLINVTIIGAEISSLFGDLIHSSSYLEMEDTTLITKSATVDDVIFYQSNEATVTIKRNFYFSCPNNQMVHKKQNLLFSNDSVTVSGLVMYYCTSCERETYNLSKSYEINKVNDTGIRNVVCGQCPMGGLCHDGIASSDNFWGWKNNHYILFNLCPPKRCCSRFGQNCLSYNTCNFKREGILCGRCIGNYSENYSIWALFPGCVLCTEKGIALFWLGVLISNGLYILFSMYKDEFVEQMKNVCFSKKEKVARIIEAHKEKRKRKKKKVNYYKNKMNKGQHKRRGAVRKKKTKHPDENELKKEEKDDLRAVRLKGLFKEILLFYQVDFALQVKSSERSFSNSDGKIHSFLSYTLGITKDKSEVDPALCPFKTNNALSNEYVFLLIVLILIMMIILLLIFIDLLKKKMCFIKKLTAYCRGRSALSRYKSKISAEEEIKPLYNKPMLMSTFQPSITLRLKCCIIELLLFYYISLATTAFKLQDCIDIAGKNRLYIEGNIDCPSKFLSWFLIIWVVALPLTMTAGAKMLQSKKIDINNFLLLSFILPPLFPFCFYWRRFTAVQDGEPEIDYILQVFSEKNPKKKDKKTAGNDTHKEKQCDIITYWNIFKKTFSLLFKGQTVLLIRKLIFAICQIKIHDPIIRMYVILAVLISFLLAHHKVPPWEDKLLNSMDFIILSVLCLLAAENLYWAFDYMSDITFTDEFRSMGDTFLYLEFLLLVPILLIAFITAILLSLMILFLPFVAFGMFWFEKKYKQKASFRLTTYV